MCTILQQTNKQTNKQTYHKKDFCLSYCNFTEQSYYKKVEYGRMK